MITLIAATLLTVKFPGGMPNEFAAALAEGVQQNVVLSQGEARLVPKAEFETADIGDMSLAIRKQTLIQMLPGTDLVFSNQLLAKRLITEVVYRGNGPAMEELVAIEAKMQELQNRRNATRDVAPETLPDAVVPVTFVSIPPTAVKDGKITFKTEKSDALQVSTLNGALSKPVRAHWIYQEVPVFVQVKDMPESDFMKWVAKSIGARLIANAKEYNFDLDPIEVRKRAIATITADNRPSGSRPEDATMAQQTKSFRISCLNALTPAQLTEALAAQGGNMRIELGPRSPLTNLAIGRVRQLEQYQKNMPVDSPAPRTAVGLLQRVDPNRSAFLIVDSRFSVRMEIPVLNENGRPGGVVRL